LITGGAQGIGYGCAEAIAEGGARVVLADANDSAVKAAAEKLGGGAVGLTCDVSDPAQVEAMFERTEKELGNVTILVNCAGIIHSAPFLDTTVEQFQRVIDVNLRGTFLTMQRAAKAMVAERIAGAIVNMSSIAAQVAIATTPAYCASKGAVMQLTKAAALALAPHGIRVNAVGPGSIDTTLLESLHTDAGAMNTVLSRTPLKRLGKPREIGDVVAFLVSAKASYMTGETVYVDGGRLSLNYTC
jgi:glucose 1-dehydrogenase